MSDTPKLIIETDSRGFGRPSRKPTVPEVLAWLQEQNVGEEMSTMWMSDTNYPDAVYPCLLVTEGRYWVVPLDPKEGM